MNNKRDRRINWCVCLDFAMDQPWMRMTAPFQAEFSEYRSVTPLLTQRTSIFACIEIYIIHICISCVYVYVCERKRERIQRLHPADVVFSLSFFCACAFVSLRQGCSLTKLPPFFLFFFFTRTSSSSCLRNRSNISREPVSFIFALTHTPLNLTVFFYSFFYV